MAGRTLYRIVLCTLVVALLLPLASASAAPIQSREDAPGIQLPGWSRILQSFDGLLDRFRSIFEGDSTQGYNPATDPGAHEGNGFDPHGGKRP